MTATLGTVSLALSGNISILCDGAACNDTPLIFFLICVAVTEQFTGYAWDSIESFTGTDVSPEYKNSVYRNWFTTALCQGAEFYVLTLYKGTSPPWIAYTITWSLFGIWAVLRVPIDASYGDDAAGRSEASSVSELGYSLLSTAAKVSLFATILAEKASG